jgi:phosphatidate cytidylyltransferase
MLKHRLFFGTLMAVFFTGVVIFDGWLDGSLSESVEDKPLQGTILFALVVILVILAQVEFSNLASTKDLKVLIPVSCTASVLLTGTWYWPQVISIFRPQSVENPAAIYPLFFLFVSVLSLPGLVSYQYFRYGTSGLIGNCGASYFSIFYLGILSSFVLAIRIEAGLWALVMFIFVVKCADIGAYAIGTCFGKHKFSPKVSPGKTWEGMGGAVLAAALVAVAFTAGCGIMSWWLGVIFGVSFAFIGQAGDLVESMIKRDAEQKDSANNVPGFGGILDIVDSPLFAAPFAYLFFMCISTVQ